MGGAVRRERRIQQTDGHKDAERVGIRFSVCVNDPDLCWKKKPAEQMSQLLLILTYFFIHDFSVFQICIGIVYVVALQHL